MKPLEEATRFHGHFCPGSALGVVASLVGLSHPVMGAATSEGMEHLVAIVEVNACFADFSQDNQQERKQHPGDRHGPQKPG